MSVTSTLAIFACNSVNTQVEAPHYGLAPSFAPQKLDKDGSDYRCILLWQAFGLLNVHIGETFLF